jgi:hypothetical protein
MAPADAVSSGDPDLLAAKREHLSRVPAVGEECGLTGSFTTVESVRWSRGRAMVTLKAAPASDELISRLEGDGWAVFPRHDPGQWFSELLDKP